MATYLATLTPVEHFFFGGEKRSELGNQSDYFLKTQFYPQQTTVLGLLRYYMLQREGKLKTADNPNPGDWTDLIGEKSFSTDDPARSFGKIKEISPVFIAKGQEFFFTRPLDFGKDIRAVSAKVSYGSADKNTSFAPDLTDFKAKIGLKNHLLSNLGTDIPLAFDDETGQGILRTIERDGNQKSRTGEPLKEAYYKQRFLKMEAGFAFAFFAEVDYAFPENQPELVVFGGERSAFMIKLEKRAEGLDTQALYQKYQPKDSFHRLVLTSDTFVKEPIVDLADFAITEVVGMRNLETTKDTKNFSRLDLEKKHPGEPAFSNRHFLYAKGSVFYFTKKEDLETVAGKIKAQAHFQTIGYNHFKTYITSIS